MPMDTYIFKIKFERYLNAYTCFCDTKTFTNNSFPECVQTYSRKTYKYFFCMFAVRKHFKTVFVNLKQPRVKVLPMMSINYTHTYARTHNNNINNNNNTKNEQITKHSNK